MNIYLMYDSYILGIMNPTEKNIEESLGGIYQITLKNAICAAQEIESPTLLRKYSEIVYQHPIEIPSTTQLY